MQRKYKIALIMVPILVALDQVTKTLVRETLSPAKVIHIIPGYLQFRLAENPGMAFGLLQNFPPQWRIPFFGLITLFAIAIIFHLLRQGPAGAIRLPVALATIMSGALGNFTDRIRWGMVVDFIRFQIWPPAKYYWPTFNLADSFITIGIALLLLDTLFTGQETLEPGTQTEKEKGISSGSQAQEENNSRIEEPAEVGGDDLSLSSPGEDIRE